jgi:hypothetical protein
MTTFTIPQATLPVGSRNFPNSGGVAVADTLSTITIVNDRTISGGMNSQPSSTTLTLEVDQSNDGGASWRQLGFGTFVGGTWTTKTGGTISQDNFFTWLFPGTSRQVRATVTVAGASVAVSGSVTVA